MSTVPFRAAILPVTPFQQNCTLVWCEATLEAAIFDPGGDLDRIEAALEEVGATPTKIALTHGHIDHAGGAQELKERLEKKTGKTIPIEGPHLADKFLLDGLAVSGSRYGMMDARPCAPDRWLNEGETFAIGQVSFDLYHCPGHSPGSIVFVHKGARIALVGDVLFAGSIGRTDLPGGNHADLINAIVTKLLPLGDDIAFICGHGPTSSFGKERQTNPFLTGEMD